ncbi:MAG: hypothetical protein AAF602_24415, partial [Myxococcota bacterium]
MRWSVLLLGTVGCGIFGGENLDPEGPAWQIGAIGTPPVEAALVYEPRANLEVPDIAFDPMFDNRLWVMMRPVADGFNDDLLCEPSNSSGCDAMPSRNAVITNLGQDDERVRVIEDTNAWHFMRRTVAMAMGEGTGFWASCGDFWTGNTTDVPIQFIGPSLWSSSLQEHGVTPPGLNGSHYDMLHGTPWCTGIAWEVDNVYWNFNGELGALDRVNFNDDHGPGEADHSDGEYERYVEGELQREPAVPSHMEIDGDWLYVADSGNGRVVRLDITSGRSRDTIQTADPVPVEIMRNATLEVFVPRSAGLDIPSGLTVQDGILYVSDFESATIVAFDTADGTEL